MNIRDCRLDPALLDIYTEDLDITTARGAVYLSLMGKKLVSCSAWWDPSYGYGKGDRSVLAVLFSDAQGHYYLHHIAYLKVRDGALDAASDQCRQVAEIAKKFFVPSITVEANGIGKFLPSVLRRELSQMKVPAAVIETYSSKPKSQRILESFDAVMAARALKVHHSVQQTPFLQEMMEWQPDQKGGFDDGLDAVAGALSLEPVRIRREYHSKTNPWIRGGGTHQARTDFPVA